MSKTVKFMLEKCQKYPYFCWKNVKNTRLYHGRVLPIEVKSGKDYQRHSALNNVPDVSNYAMEEAFVFTNYNVQVQGSCVYYPIYMVMFLQNDAVRLPKIDLDDLSDVGK